jgi:hypothetical protein
MPKLKRTSTRGLSEIDWQKLRQSFSSRVIKDGVKYRWVRGFEGLYIVSIHGDVISTGRNVPLPNGGYWSKPECFMRKRLSQFGYECVSLCINGKKHNKFLHRLIMEAFNKLNNDINNLEWCTASQNVKHAFDTGLKTMPTGEANWMYGRKNEALAQLNRSRAGEKKSPSAKILRRGIHPSAIAITNGNKIWACIKDAAEELNENYSTIHKMVKRKNNRLNLSYVKQTNQTQDQQPI